jgi:hypothetical protein
MDQNSLPEMACSAGSRTLDEPLYGSVKPARYWLMLEYDHAYGAKALADSKLSKSIKKHLDAAKEELDPCRVLLIRQHPRLIEGDLRFFLAVADELAPALYEFQLPAYAALLDLNFGELVADPEELATYRRRSPIFLVCTNGKRDPCCAANGTPVYKSLSETLDEQIWQTSHVGGHRLSANMVCMPHALFYGRVTPSAAYLLSASYQLGEMVLRHYRGRGCYPEIVQVAEYFLRRDLGEYHIGALKLETYAEEPANFWQVRFLETDNDRPHTVSLQVNPEGFQLRTSCKDSEPSATASYELLELK